MKLSRSQSGFSLVELSIVLVILGLLTGGILGGQALIRAAELRSLSAEVQRYTTAVRTFQDKYFAMPGDMANATAFWGKSAADCNTQSGVAATPGTCNGNGNGILDIASAVSGTGEVFRGWQHMALAGLIEGNYTGNSGAASTYDPDAGINAPASRLSNGIWGYGYYDNSTILNTYNFNYDMRNWFVVGSQDDNVYPDGPLLKPEEAWNIDSKLDDGLPGVGRIITNLVNLCSNGTSSSDRGAVYLLNNSAANCSLSIRSID